IRDLIVTGVQTCALPIYVACPWCAVGLWSLDRALAALGDSVEVDLRFEPFELNPTMPSEGEDTIQYISRKYGAPPEQIARNRERSEERRVGKEWTAGKGT